VPRDLVYPAVIGGMRLLFRLAGLRVDVEGAENIPTHGPVILASNHVSFLDFAFAGFAARASRRYVRFLTRYDVWHNPFAGPLMRGMHHIPVDRAAPAGAYLEARSALLGGEAVGIFPEAGVSKSYTVRMMMPGAAALARETGAPLVPMAMWGGQRIYTATAAATGHQLHLRRGRPITIVVGKARFIEPDRDIVAETRLLGACLQTLLDSAQARHPDQPAPGEHPPWHPAHLGGSAPTREQAAAIEQPPRHATLLQPPTRH
jgi:1-acyl-sn-glycerol-3-phosphate acyltransferase